MISTSNTVRLLSLLSLALPSSGLPRVLYPPGPELAPANLQARHHKHHSSYHPGAAGNATGHVSSTGYFPTSVPSGLPFPPVSASGFPTSVTGGSPFPPVSASTFPTSVPSGLSSPPVSASGFVLSGATPISRALPSISYPTANPTSTNIIETPPIGNGFLRGVNIGGWLILEKWMNGDVFTGAGADAADQFNFDSSDGAAQGLEKHWSTWFTEADVQSLKSYGINALRIPIGFWAYDNSGTPYLQGADVYLEKAIGWARSAGMQVWIDCHGQPGSQNGFDNSGHAGPVLWQQGSNLQQSIAVLTTMAQKYGSTQYADTVVGLELVNEPLSDNGNNFDTTVQFARDAYQAVRNAAANPNLMIVMHDAFRGPNAWTDTATSLGPRGSFGIDTHIYQVFSDVDKTLDQPAHISQACSKSSELSSANAIAPTFVGEWSGATDICVNPDGSTTAGSSCTVDGCQCQGDPLENWNDQMVEQVGKFVEAQLDTYEANSSGYFFWSWGGPGAWGFKEGVEKGIIPNPVTSRKWGNQCG